MREILLQDCIVPVCAAEVRGGHAELRRLEGTAFFINENGVFVTARHVLEPVAEDKSFDLVWGLNVKSLDKSAANRFAHLQIWESAPYPFDVAVGKIHTRSLSWFSIPRKLHISPWQDVATQGYPKTAIHKAQDVLNINMRCLKGYILRDVQAGTELTRPHPDCYELSFPIAKGMSGAPLFVANNGRQEVTTHPPCS